MRLVIVGNGVAGITTARFVAERDPSVEITVYSDERYPYYPRPRLVELLAGQVLPENMAFYPDEWYTKRRIRTVLGCRVLEIRPEVHEILLDDGRAVPYDRLVLAVGAQAAVPPIIGSDLPGVYTLRSMRDALALCDKVRETKQAIILGGGLLGLDTAGALRTHGIAVCVVELLPRLLPRQLDVEGASLLQRIIEDKGIQILVGDSCTAIEGQGVAERVRLKSGRVIEAQMVVISAGVRPDLELASRAGLRCGRGIIVDERLRTSMPDIYAVGDVAEYNQRVWGIIPAALAQARVAAAQIVKDSATIYQDIVPSTTLKVAGIDLISVGEIHPEDGQHLDLRYVDATAGVYKKLVVRGAYAVGAIVLGDKADVRSAAQIVERRMDVSSYLNELFSQGFNLASLLRADAARERAKSS